MNEDELYYLFTGRLKQAEQDFENKILEICCDMLKERDNNECTRHE